MQQALLSSKTVEQYTPKDFVNKTISYLGEIDLDPCSNPGKNIPAKTHYTKEIDGLKQRWFGKVFVNPPYGRDIKFWVEKAIAEKDNCDEILLLLPSRTDTVWFQSMNEYKCCFLKGRLKFLNPDNQGNSAPFPSVVVSISKENKDREFYSFWERYGRVDIPFRI